MPNEENQHIKTEEFARLLEKARQSGDSGRSVAEAHPHLTVCSTCREEFETLAQQERELEIMRAAHPSEPQTNCPPAAVWRHVLTPGFIDEDQTSLYLEHASGCDHCGPLLRDAVEELAELSVELDKELTEEERRTIAGLESARTDWQVRLAERITGTPRMSGDATSWWKRWATVPTLGAAGVTIVAVMAAAWWISGSRVTANSATRLLASAYTEQRTLELRIPGASYAPLRVQKGPAESFAARPTALLKAEALIKDELASHPDDPAWLEASARANLLEGKYDAAVESLQRALELRPDSPELLLDLGTAHFQRGQSEDLQEDYGAAFENLSKVLAQQPGNTTALFNRAIVAEHQFLYRQALEDWEHYLKLDSYSDWAEEARGRAEAVRTKLKEHGGTARLLLAPSEISAAVMEGEVNERVEEYLGEAVRNWLPQAFPESGSREGDRSAQRALFLLANLSSEEHDDQWLLDLLKGSSAPQFSKAVAALARAAAANDAGDYEASSEQAGRAEQLFRAGGNEAGTLRARFEDAFSAQLSRKIDKCRQQSGTALSEARKYPYSWLQIQFGLEQGVCAELTGDLGGSGKSVKESLELSQKVGYSAVSLRATGFLAAYKFGAGDTPDARKLLATGLENYWSGKFAAVRGYSLYNVLGSYVDAAKEPHLKVAVWREAVKLIDSDPDYAMRAGAYSGLGNAAASAHQLRLAKDSFAEAARLFALAPRTGASLLSQLEIEIRVAQLEAREGHLSAAVEQLTRNQEVMRQLSDAYLGQMFYLALGEVQLRSQQPADAEQSLRVALMLTERKLASLNSEAERIIWSQDTAPVYLAMSEAELKQGRTQDSLAVYEWYLGSAQRAGDASKAGEIKAEPDSTWLTSRLPMLSGRTVIAYGVLPDGLAIWTYDDRGVNAQWVPAGSDELPNLGERFYDLCSDRYSQLSAVRRDARSLYAALVAPIENRLEPGRTLVIEANGWASRVPFEPLMDASGRTVIAKWPVVHSLGQYSDARAHSTGTVSAARNALVVASTASSQARDLIPLPDVMGEAKMVASGFQSAEILGGHDATVDAVVESLPKAEVFHFTGHSLRTPERSGLLLAGTDDASTPNLLAADNLHRLDLENLQLAVLSTCNSELGNDGARGFSSVAEAFERSGVPHVVASRWPVDSMETRRTMQIFYDDLLSGQTVSNALRSTAEQLMSDASTAHPYFWAAFAAYGQP